MNDTTSGPTGPAGTDTGGAPPPPPGPQRPPLRRPREGRLIAGVAAGVAQHVGMDVAIVRILFVVVTIFTSGVGIAAYALAWILVPEPTEGDVTRTPTTPRRELGGRDPLFWVGVGMLVVGILWLLDRPGFASFGPWLRPDRGVLFPLVLIAFGVALWRVGEDRRRPGHRPSHPVSPPAWQQAAVTTPSRSSEEVPVSDEPTAVDHPQPPAGFSPPPGPPAVEEPSWSPPPVPARERSILVRSTLGLALVTAGVLWLLRIAEVITLGTGRILAAALLVIGLGLLVGAVAGRGRSLIAFGMVLLPIVVIAELLHPMSFELAEFRQAAGDHLAAPAALEDLEPSYQLGAGTLTVDLSSLELTGDHSVSVQVMFGEAIVIVPDDVSVELSGRVAGGELVAFGRSRGSGLGVDRTLLDEVDDEVGLLELDVQVAFGQATVRRVPATTPTTDR